MYVLGVIGVILSAALVGHLFYRAFATGEESASWGEVLFVQLLLGLLLCGWPALALAELGLFSLPRWALAIGAAVAVVLAWRWGQVRRWRWPRLRFRWAGLGVLVLFLVLGAFLAYPGEPVLGGQDPGVYLATGASIARTGGILLQDPWIASLPESARTLVLPYYTGQWWQLPGFYVTDFAGGQVTPQFLHLYPAWLAAFYAAGGLEGALLATPLLTLLGLAALFFLARRLFGRWPAVVAVVLLALNPALVWFAREPAAEALALVLVLGGWYLLERAHAEPGRRDLAVLAGVALGQLALAKIELLLLPLLLYGYFLLRLIMGRLRANDRAFLVAQTVLLVHAGLHIVLLARPYLLTLEASLRNSRLPLSPEVLATMAVLSALAGALLLYLLRRPLARGLERLWGRPWLRHGGPAGLWLLLVVWAGVLYPLLTPARFQVNGVWHENLERLTFLRLAWYLAPAGLALGVLGLLWWLGRRLRAASLPFLTGLLIFLFLYTCRTWVHPYHFWMMRRYIPLIFPCLALGTALALWRVRVAPLGPAVRRGGALLLLGLLLFQAAQADRPLAARLELAGTAAALDELAAQLPADAPILVDQLGYALATPLRYLYGRPAFALANPDPYDEEARAGDLPWAEVWPLLQQWPADSPTAYLLLGQVPDQFRGGMSLAQIYTFTLDVRATERSYEHLPRDSVALHSLQWLYRLERRPASPTFLEFSLLRPEWTGERLAIDLPAPAGPLLLRLRAAGFRPEPLPPAHLAFLWQGHEVASYTLERSFDLQEIELELPVTSTAATGRLEIVCQTWNPRQAGFGDDPRDLGILLQYLAVREQD